MSKHFNKVFFYYNKRKLSVYNTDDVKIAVIHLAYLCMMRKYLDLMKEIVDYYKLTPCVLILLKIQCNYAQ